MGKYKNIDVHLTNGTIVSLKNVKNFNIKYNAEMTCISYTIEWFKPKDRKFVHFKCTEIIAIQERNPSLCSRFKNFLSKKESIND